MKAEKARPAGKTRPASRSKAPARRKASPQRLPLVAVACALAAVVVPSLLPHARPAATAGRGASGANRTQAASPAPPLVPPKNLDELFAPQGQAARAETPGPARAASRKAFVSAATGPSAALNAPAPEAEPGTGAPAAPEPVQLARFDSPEPFVSELEAREAVELVGIDPEAEELWVQAINDPRMPAPARRELIEVLDEAGFPDPQHPTPLDLPLIASRLELIQDLMPDALDEVNVEAFADVYHDLSDMQSKISKA